MLLLCFSKLQSLYIFFANAKGLKNNLEKNELDEECHPLSISVYSSLVLKLMYFFEANLRWWSTQLISNANDKMYYYNLTIWFLYVFGLITSLCIACFISKKLRLPPRNNIERCWMAGIIGQDNKYIKVRAYIKLMPQYLLFSICYTSLLLFYIL